MKEQKLNAYGMTPLTAKHYFVGPMSRKSTN